MGLVNVASRDQIAQALEDVVVAAASSALGGIDITHSRRLRGPDEIEPAQMPAVFLHQLAESVEYPQGIVGSSPKRTMHFEAWVYTSSPQADSVQGITDLNCVVDAIAQTLPSLGAPNSGLLPNLCTLGGLVTMTRVQGTIQYFPARSDGKSVAIVPIVVLRP